MSMLQGCSHAMKVYYNIILVLDRSGSYIKHYKTTLVLQVKIEVSHHALQDGAWKTTKPLVFVLDNIPEEKQKKVKKELKEKKRKLKKEGTDGISMKNFGAHLDVPKIKSAEHLTTAWRCRFLACQFQDVCFFG